MIGCKKLHLEGGMPKIREWLTRHGDDIFALAVTLGFPALLIAVQLLAENYL